MKEYIIKHNNHYIQETKGCLCYVPKEVASTFPTIESANEFIVKDLQAYTIQREHVTIIERATTETAYKYDKEWTKCLSTTK